MFSKSDDKAKFDQPTSSFGRGGGSATPSLISADLTVVGNLESAGDLQIDGKVKGDIKSRSVTVGESAEVKGSIVADTARICGKLNGTVQASSVTVAKTAKTKGDIVHQSLSIEAGAEIEGQIRRLGAEQTVGDTKPAPQKAPEVSSAPKAAAATGAPSGGGVEGKPAVG
jgi:cytoskeletal protein CcmA (bactofilin family)